MGSLFQKTRNFDQQTVFGSDEVVRIARCSASKSATGKETAKSKKGHAGAKFSCLQTVCVKKLLASLHVGNMGRM